MSENKSDEDYRTREQKDFDSIGLPEAIAKDLIAEVKAGGRKIDVIKKISQFTGVGLKEAKQFIDRYT